jgi:RHS repeat-associated protein
MSVYYLADGLGSTMATTDASGNIVNTFTYDPYGATTSSTGSQPNAFQFTGQATDATGLQYLRARYYDPSTGTFISSDPMGVSPAWKSLRQRQPSVAHRSLWAVLRRPPVRQQP